MHSSIDGSCASAVRPMWWLVGFFVTCLVVAPRLGAAQTADARNRDASVAVTPAGYSVAASPRPASYPLGIMARNTATGVEVVSVNQGSVAQSAGLQSGDTIVTVGGYQVGLVGDKLYDVGDEVSRRVAPNGQVPLLVRNGRTGTLLLTPAQFGSTSRAITGVLTTAQGVQVPSTAVITVRLLDITEPQWRDVALTQGQLPVARGFPVSYRLDPPAATPAHRYAVDARVEDGGRVLLQTVLPVAVPSLDREQRVDLVLAQQAAPAANAVAPAAQIQQWIQTYLGRPPRPYETEVWLADLQQGKSLTDVQAGILSSSEYFERQRSNRDLYVTDVFRQLYGTAPTPAQLADLQTRYDRAGGVRLPFVQQLLMQPR
ncbi:MAG: YbaY family lipoprotein [Planctomycetia bacterium]